MRSIIRYLSLAAAAQSAIAVKLDVTNTDSIKSAAKTIAFGMMSYYKGNVTNTPETIGVLPAPFYWWEGGAMWGSMLDYYHFTGDDQYNKVVTQALLSQVGPNYDYMVPVHAKDEGNDDQAFWGFATMSAAEKDYPQPTVGNYSWVQLTENLWNTQVRRWDTSTCGGGLKWQIFAFNNGYDYKNSVSNGAFFQLSARLARFTGNQTYLDWAEKTFQWMQDVNLMDDDYHIYDGANDNKNCNDTNKVVWTYNGAIALYGSAILYNYTNGSSVWQERTSGLLNATANFFSPFDNSSNIMYEPACETVNTCNNDQFSFKAYLARFMWATTIVAPWTKANITTILTDTSKAAAQSCSGPSDGVTCGEHWYEGGYDGKYGVGQQMSALEAIQGLLIADSVPPLHNGQVHLMPTTTTSTTSSATPTPTSTATPTPTEKKKSAGGRNEPDSLMWPVLAIMTVMMGMSELAFGI